MKITPELEAVARAIYENDIRTQQPPLSGSLLCRIKAI